ncbi:MAG TPA: YraN family protein [Williamwhitmania sp.]|nr:YraN family protein [Williamwhitmania sp.]
MDEKNRLGEVGEAKAMEFLVYNGFEIVATNWRYGHKEIDIVARKDGLIHVVEVKTRATDYYEEPKEAVKRKKQRNLVEAADAFAVKYNIEEEVQFDIISIVMRDEKFDLEYIPQAFYPGL